MGIAGTLRTPGLDRGTRLARAGARHLSGRVVRLALDVDMPNVGPRHTRPGVTEVREDGTTGTLWRALVVLAAVLFVIVGLAL